MTETYRSRIRAELARRKWSQAALSRESGVDKNTISDFMTGKREASAPTLAKIEDALGMTHGTLAAAGEEPGPAAQAGSASLRGITDEELAAELSYRLTQRRRELEDAFEELHFLRGRYRDAIHDLAGGIDGYDPEAGTQDGVALDELEGARRERARDRAAIPTADRPDWLALAAERTDELTDRERQQLGLGDDGEGSQDAGDETV